MNNNRIKNSELIGNKFDDFSFFKYGPFLFLALSLIMLTIVGFLATFYNVDQVVSLSPGTEKDLHYTILSQERGVVTIGVNNGIGKAIIDITITDTNRKKQVITEEISFGYDDLRIEHSINKIQYIEIDVKKLL